MLNEMAVGGGEGGEEKVVQKVIEGWRRGNLVKKRV